MSTLDQRNDRALGYDYPAGAEHDPRSPWNEKSDEPCEKCAGEGIYECKTCVGRGCLECDLEGQLACQACDSTGVEHKPTAEDIADDKADRARDEDQDRKAEGRDD